MKLHTAAAVFSYSQKLEDDSSAFYENLVKTFSESEKVLNSLIADKKKDKTAVKRTYYGVISDALEGCFSFQDIDSDEFALEPELRNNGTFREALELVIASEEKIVKFYLATSESSDSLMADLPRLFRRLAKKRKEHIRVLRKLLEQY